LPVAAMAAGTTFATAEDAAQALAAAARANDRAAVQALFGAAADDLLPVDEADHLRKFTTAFDVAHQLVSRSATTMVLEVGADNWPFPVPLAQRDGRWFFDTVAGKEELLNRCIGRNELATLKVVRAYVEAQRDYARHDHNGDEVLEYAQKFVSAPCAKDGLYWTPELAGEISPLGPLVAFAQGAVAGKTKAATAPYRGYYFKILTRQGGRAPGGAYCYIINGRMIAGFGLVAWPAEYGTTGVMTFIVNQQGRVYQKDLGARTDRIAPSMMQYDPDSTWRISPD